MELPSKPEYFVVDREIIGVKTLGFRRIRLNTYASSHPCYLSDLPPVLTI